MNTPITELTLPVEPQVKQGRWGRSADFATRFWQRVDQTGGPDACWPWTASRFDTGYGCVWFDGKARKAHRIAWSLTHGTITDGVHILHRCDNPPCCNPAHLFAGSSKDNTADMLAKGRGNRDGRRHLTLEVIPGIRERYAAGGTTLKQLASEHGVTYVAIWKVIHRKTWADVA